MGKRTFVSDIDLALNQLLQAKFENLASDPGGAEGRFYYNTVVKKLKYHNGTIWITPLDQLSINDTGNSTSEVFSSNKVLALISGLNSAMAGALINQGGYNAATNTPLLDATPIAGIKNGWTYTITAVGNFFTEVMAIGDMIIANKDNPTLVTDWTLVNKNIADILDASETDKGIIQLATQAETTAGTNDVKAITPLKLKTNLGITGTLSVARKFTQIIGDGLSLTYAVTHGMAASPLLVGLYRTATPFDEVICEVIHTSSSIITFNFNVAPTAGQYTVVIVG